MSSPAELSRCYEGLNAGALGSAQHFHIWNTVLPLDVENCSKVTELDSGQGLDVLAVKSCTFGGIEQARQNGNGIHLHFGFAVNIVLAL